MIKRLEEKDYNENCNLFLDNENPTLYVGFERFTGNLPLFIYQDIYAQIVFYNQIQDMLYTGRKDVKPKEGNKYKINEGKATRIFKENT